MTKTSAAPGPPGASVERDLTQTWVAMMLAPSLEVCEALLRGESVPVDRLDQEWVERLGRRPF